LSILLLNNNLQVISDRNLFTSTSWVHHFCLNICSENNPFWLAFPYGTFVLSNMLFRISRKMSNMLFRNPIINPIRSNMWFRNRQLQLITIIAVVNVSQNEYQFQTQHEKTFQKSIFLYESEKVYFFGHCNTFRHQLLTTAHVAISHWIVLLII